MSAHRGSRKGPVDSQNDAIDPFSDISDLQSSFRSSCNVFKVTRLGRHNCGHSNLLEWAYLVCRAPKGVKSDAYVSSSLGTNCSRNGSRWSTVFRASFGADAYPWHADCREGRNA